MFLYIVLKEIDLAKEILQTDLTFRNETVIPIQLMQDQLPLSYKFYDPIFRIVNERMDEEWKEYFGFRYQLNMQRLKDDFDLKKKIFQITGIQKKLNKKSMLDASHYYPMIRCKL